MQLSIESGIDMVSVSGFESFECDMLVSSEPNTDTGHYLKYNSKSVQTDKNNLFTTCISSGFTQMNQEQNSAFVAF